MISISGKYTECKPLFLEEHKIAVVSSGSVLQLLSLITGELVGSLRGHTTNVSSVIPHHELKSHIISTDFAGTIVVWDFLRLKEVTRCETGNSICEVISCPSLSSSGQLLPEELLLVQGRADMITGNSRDDGSKLVIYNTEKKKTRKKVADMKYAQNCTALLSPAGGGAKAQHRTLNSHYVVVGSRRKLVFWALGKEVQRGTAGERVVTSCAASETSITALALAAQRGLVVTGHESGEMVLWHDLQGWLERAIALKTTAAADKPLPPPPCTVLHWHAHAVKSLAFSVDGGIVYSGGLEGVLVLWQTTSHSKSFVPRLGAPVKHISAGSGGAKVLVTCSDNSVRLINSSSMRDEWTLRSPCLGSGDTRGGQSSRRSGLAVVDEDTEPSAGKHSTISVGVNCVNGMVTINGYPGQLQMVDISASCLPTALTEGDITAAAVPCTVSDMLQVVSYNRVSKIDNSVTGWNKPSRGSKLYVPTVPLFTFHSYSISRDDQPSAGRAAGSSRTSQHYLATVDVTRGEEFGPESSLKIWRWDYSHPAGSQFRLITQADRPHSGNRLTSLAFLTLVSPVAAALATSSADGTVKIWNSISSRTLRNGSATDNESWVCAFSFRYRCCPCEGLSVSKDSSLLAVGHGALLTLWDPNSVEMRGLMALPTPCGDSAEANDKLQCIRHTAFVEPCRASCNGGGCGESFLVAATALSIYVIDLLTMEITWSRTFDSVQSFAVAADESMALLFPDEVPGGAVGGSSSNLSVTRKEGWIAACVSVNGESEVLTWSPVSAEPLVRYPCKSPASAITFWSAADPINSPCRTLLLSTEDGQLLMMRAVGFSLAVSAGADAAVPLAVRNKKAGSRTDLPRVLHLGEAPSTSAAPGDSDDSMSDYDAEAVLAGSSAGGSSVFASGSTMLPVSSLYAGFMRQVLGAKRANDVGNPDHSQAVDVEWSHENSAQPTDDAVTSHQPRRSLVHDSSYTQKMQQRLATAFSSAGSSTRNEDDRQGASSKLVEETPKKKKVKKSHDDLTPAIPTPASSIAAGAQKASTTKSTSRSRRAKK